MEHVGDSSPQLYHSQPSPRFEPLPLPKALRLFCIHPFAQKGFYTDPRTVHADVFGHAQGVDLGSGSWCPVAWCWPGLQAPEAVGVPSGLEAHWEATSSFGQVQFYLQENPSLLITHCFNSFIHCSLRPIGTLAAETASATMPRWHCSPSQT